MKKISILVLLLISAMLLASCATTFDGYYYDLDKCRSSEKRIYNEYDYLFTAEYDGGMIDFVVQGESLHIVQFLARKDNTQYLLKVRASYLISEYLSDFYAKNEYCWSQPTIFDLQGYRWCIVEKSFNTSHDSLPAFEFAYNDTVLHLCYEIGSESF